MDLQVEVKNKQTAVIRIDNNPYEVPLLEEISTTIERKWKEIYA